MGFREISEQEIYESRKIGMGLSEDKRSKLELAVLDSMPSAIEQYLSKGGKVTVCPPMSMRDPESEEERKSRVRFLRDYDGVHRNEGSGLK